MDTDLFEPRRPQLSECPFLKYRIPLTCTVVSHAQRQSVAPSRQDLFLSFTGPCPISSTIHCNFGLTCSGCQIIGWHAMLVLHDIDGNVQSAFQRHRCNSRQDRYPLFNPRHPHTVHLLARKLCTFPQGTLKERRRLCATNTQVPAKRQPCLRCNVDRVYYGAYCPIKRHAFIDIAKLNCGSTTRPIHAQDVRLISLFASPDHNVSFGKDKLWLGAQ